MNIIKPDNTVSDYEELLSVIERIVFDKVKEETINGDKATVEVEIEVSDYTKALKHIFYDINKYLEHSYDGRKIVVGKECTSKGL